MEFDLFFRLLYLVFLKLFSVWVSSAGSSTNTSRPLIKEPLAMSMVISRIIVSLEKRYTDMQAPHRMDMDTRIGKEDSLTVSTAA